MSIDHGKLLAALANELRSVVPEYCVAYKRDERLRALAQPAEAVEGERRFLRATEDADAREIGETDAAQGEVATHENIGRIIGAARSRIESANKRHGNQWKQGGRTAINFIEKRLHRLFNRPAAKAAHPQAAPAQGGGMVLVGYVYNNRCVATDESRKEGCLQGEFAQSLPNGTQLFAAAPSPSSPHPEPAMTESKVGGLPPLPDIGPEGWYTRTDMIAYARAALSAHGQPVVDERISRAWKLVERWEQPTIDGDTLTKEERLRNMGFAAMLRAALGATP